uniref:Ig-like domain-containing protein n=1 Tax=Tetraodon nigroviridis TaxID=99883 RepID=H3CVU8_TETNG
VLFQSVVLPCQYNSVSTQTPVVQWVYKSYCRDRTRDSFSHADVLSGGLGGGGLSGYLDCADSGRTVRTVASISGSSVTLSEYYKSRDISIINKADLRIGEVQWGDSGVYICKVVISDDLEGQNEASVELLVLGFSSVPEDLLPDFDLKIMPEWVFVAAVALGSVLFLLLVGICWCQCCPHSCCCYVSCWCCPDTCCCPRHLYEAGKGVKTGTSTPQTPAYPPYFVTGVPAMVPIAPPSLVDKVSTVPPSDGSLLTAACSLSELSSLHEGETGFHQTYRSVQKKALPPILDHDAQPEPQRSSDNRSPEPRHPHFRDSLCKKSPMIWRCRWNPRSEHLHRKKYQSAGRSGSLDELEEFVASYKQRRGRGAEESDGEQGVYEMEFQEFSRYPSHRVRPPQHCHEKELESCGVPKDPPRQRPTASPPSSLLKEKDYDSTFLSSLLEHKAKLRGVVHGRSGEDSDAPSKSSSKKGSGEASRHCSRAPSSRPEAESLPPYPDSERSRTDRPSPRLAPTIARSSQTLAHSPRGHREEPRDKTRKANTLLSRDSLIV